jgi:Right handed beta helix region
MKRIKFLMNTTVALGVLLMACSLAQAAGATRTWVSGVGDDLNSCSRTAPCKTFAGAYVKTAAGGQINVIDAGPYGTLTIDHAITIDASESFAGVLGYNDVPGFIINAGASDVVVLRGLTIEGAGGSGIKFIAGGKLYVEDCTISGFQEKGIDFVSNDKSELFVKDTIIRNNGGAGIQVQAGANGSIKATIDHSKLDGNKNGLSALDNVRVTIRDSVASHSGTNGVVLTASAAGAPEVSVENCLLTNNVSYGIKVNGKALVRLSGSTVTANDTGLFVSGGGVIDSYGDNNIDGNLSANGAPNNTTPQM